MCIIIVHFILRHSRAFFFHGCGWYWHNQFYNTQRWPTWTSHSCYRCDTGHLRVRTHTHAHMHAQTHTHTWMYQHAHAKQLLDWICINNNSNMHVIILCPWKHGITQHHNVMTFWFKKETVYRFFIKQWTFAKGIRGSTYFHLNNDTNNKKSDFLSCWILT